MKRQCHRSASHQQPESKISAAVRDYTLSWHHLKQKGVLKHPGRRERIKVDCNSGIMEKSGMKYDSETARWILPSGWSLDTVVGS